MTRLYQDKRLRVLGATSANDIDFQVQKIIDRIHISFE